MFSTKGGPGRKGLGTTDTLTHNIKGSEDGLSFFLVCSFSVHGGFLFGSSFFRSLLCHYFLDLP